MEPVHYRDFVDSEAATGYLAEMARSSEQAGEDVEETTTTSATTEGVHVSCIPQKEEKCNWAKETKSYRIV